MSGIRKCATCGRLFKIEDAGPEPMRSDGTFPKHVCPTCSTPMTVDDLPQIQSETVREFLDALETLHRCDLRDLAQQPDSALSPAGLRLKRAYINLRLVEER